MSGDSYSPEATIKTELEEAAVLEDQLPAPDDDALPQSGQEASLQGAASLSTKPRIKSTLLAKLACRQRVYTPGFSVAMNGSLLTSLQPDRSPDDDSLESIQPGTRSVAGTSPELRSHVTLRRRPAAPDSHGPPSPSPSRPREVSRLLPGAVMPSTGVKRGRSLSESTGLDQIEQLDVEVWSHAALAPLPDDILNVDTDNESVAAPHDIVDIETSSDEDNVPAPVTENAPRRRYRPWRKMSRRPAKRIN